MTDADLRHVDFDGKHLAYRQRNGRSPTLLFLPGYASDMEGAKALALDDFAKRSGHALLRFDYSGTGSSEGSFDDGTLAGWIDEALHMLDQLTKGPAVLVGSSMGGWIALHLALQRPERIAALVGIAAAPDFTDWGFTDEKRTELRSAGRLEEPNPYGPEPFVTTLGFWQSGQQLLLLERPIALDCPVRLIHGDQDNDVPLPVAYRLLQQLRSADVQLTIVKGGGHRMSQRHEIDAILRAVAALVEPAQ
ncbi:alpha/beta hydrolase [soil metagenome]